MTFKNSIQWHVSSSIMFTDQQASNQRRRLALNHTKGGGGLIYPTRTCMLRSMFFENQPKSAHYVILTMFDWSIVFPKIAYHVISFISQI